MSDLRRLLTSLTIDGETFLVEAINTLYEDMLAKVTFLAKTGQNFGYFKPDYKLIKNHEFINQNLVTKAIVRIFVREGLEATAAANGYVKISWPPTNDNDN